MRYALTLRALDDPTVIPMNYNYPLAAAIYKIIAAASPEYSQWLHSQGYLLPDGKPMKLFTFSRLTGTALHAVGATLVLRKNDRCTLYISSPMLEDFMKNFVIGLFTVKNIIIASQSVRGRFLVDRVERIDLPEIAGEVKCVALSPFVASTMKQHNGRVRVYYYRPGDEELSEALKNNAVNKYFLIHKRMPENDDFTVTLDQEYIQRRGGNNRITKLITVKEGSEEETRILSIHCPVTLRGNAELIDAVLQAGLGEKNSLGFGMLATLAAAM